MMTLLIVLIGMGAGAVLLLVTMHVLGMIELYLPDDPEPRSCPPCDGGCNQGRNCPSKE